MTYEEQLLVAALPAEGGGTALRAQGQVVWFPVRPPSERLPSGVKLIQIVSLPWRKPRVEDDQEACACAEHRSQRSKPSSGR